MRYFFEISYLGTNYSGWQRQKNVSSIQQTIENQFDKIFSISSRIHGCGRTDAGVHASQYFFHIDLENDFDFEALKYKLNRMFPADISIINIQPVASRANAQKDAILRTYDYHIHLKKDPFIDHISYYENDALDLEAIKTALKPVVGQHDFRYFCKSPDKQDNCICIIRSAELFVNDEETKVQFQFSGNRFLHHMIRLLVGNLLKIGKGTLSIQQFHDYIELRNEPKYFDIAYPQGLFLSKVDYRI